MENRINISIDRSAPEFISGVELGITYTQRGMDNYGHPVATQKAEKLIKNTCRLMNVHIHGWGTFFPKKDNGEWDWSTLDRRVAHIEKMGGTPVMTLCGAPDWMKGPYDPEEERQYMEHGQQWWWWFEKSPLPEFFEEFAAVSVEAAKRYPHIRHFQIWNEMKGFVHEDRNFDFDDHSNIYYEEYTEFYNIVYNALKAHDPTLQVGGFYAVLQGSGTEKGDYHSCKPIAPHDREALLYWLEHKVGADFICVDRGMNHWWDKNTYTNDEVIDTAAEFENIMHQIHELCDLPIWWSEYYFSGPKGTPFMAASAAALHYHIVRGRGETKALLWNPLDTEHLNTAIVTDTGTESGGEPTCYYPIYHAFNTHFAEGQPIYKVSVSAPEDVLCMAGNTATVLINKRDREYSVSLDGVEITLKPYAVEILEK